jgi:hypothetical protein
MPKIEESIDQLIQLMNGAEPDLDQLENCAWDIASQLEPFNWTEWERGLDASRDPSLISAFSRDEALRFIQMLTRQQRFSEGDFSIDGKYVSTKNAFFGSKLDDGTLEKLARVLQKFKMAD